MSLTKSLTKSSLKSQAELRARQQPKVSVAGRHDHHHRLGFLRRNQVVEDETGAAHRGPRIVAIAGAVQQIKDGIFLGAGLVAGRRVDVHAPEFAEAFGIIRTLATAPCGTSLVSMKSAPGTYTMLQALPFDSLTEGLRGSITDTPSTLKL